MYRSVVSRLPAIWQFVLGTWSLLFVLVCAWVYTFGLDEALDLRLHDETHYMRRGLGQELKDLNLQYGPLYSLWYRFMSLRYPDPLILEMRNIKYLAIAVPVVFYWVLRSQRLSIPTAAAASIFLLRAPCNVEPATCVSHFCLLILMVPFCIDKAVNRPRLKTWVFFSAAFLAAYVRPEFYLSAVLLGTVLIGKQLAAKRYLAAGVALALLITPTVFLGVPVSGERSFFAFSQHFSRHVHQSEHSNVNAYFDYERLMQDEFPQATTLAEAAVSNPAAFIWHLKMNVYTFPDSLWRAFFMKLPANAVSETTAILSTLGIVVVAVGVAVGGRRRFCASLVSGRAMLRNLLSSEPAMLLVPVLISVLVIYPNPWYLLLLFVLGLLVMLDVTFDDRPVKPNRAVDVVCVFACVMMVSPLYGAPQVRPQHELISMLRETGVEQGTTILSADDNYAVFIDGAHDRSIYSLSVGELAVLLREHKVLVVVSPSLCSTGDLQRDQLTQEVCESPDKFGLMRLPTQKLRGWEILISDTSTTSVP